MGVYLNLKERIEGHVNQAVCLKSWIMNIQLDVWVVHHMMCRQNYFLTRYDDKSMTLCHPCHLSHGQFINVIFQIENLKKNPEFLFDIIWKRKDYINFIYRLYIKYTV